MGDNLTPDGYESLFDGRETDTVTDLIIGAPGPSTLRGASRLFAEAAAHCAEVTGENGQVLFQYGPRAGNQRFKAALAK